MPSPQDAAFLTGPIVAGRHRGRLPQAGSARAGPQPRDVRGVRGQPAHHDPRARWPRPEPSRVSASPGFVLAIAAWLWLTVLFANFAEAVAEGRGKAQAAALRSTRRDVQAKRLAGDRGRTAGKLVSANSLRKGDLFLVEARETDSRRRRGHRGRGIGRRERHHRRIRAGAARGRRRFLVRDRRHARALGLAGRARHQQPGRVVPRPDDRDGRRRQARQDAERDRAVDPARDADAGVPARHRDARAVLGVRRGDAPGTARSSRSWCWSRCSCA